MQFRTPITLVTGPLGSGKTTLLRHILATRLAKIAIVMNEFGEIAIDAKVIEGKNVRIAELGGGCVCCSLLGEFEAAVNEIIEKVAPEMIVVETTGLAEPEDVGAAPVDKRKFDEAGVSELVERAADAARQKDGGEGFGGTRGGVVCHRMSISSGWKE